MIMAPYLMGGLPPLWRACPGGTCPIGTAPGHPGHGETRQPRAKHCPDPPDSDIDGRFDPIFRAWAQWHRKPYPLATTPLGSIPMARLRAAPWRRDVPPDYEAPDP